MPSPSTMLVEVTNPYTRETYRVHPHVAETMVWLPPLDGTAESRESLRALLPGWKGFVAGLIKIKPDPEQADITE